MQIGKNYQMVKRKVGFQIFYFQFLQQKDIMWARNAQLASVLVVVCLLSTGFSVDQNCLYPDANGDCQKNGNLRQIASETSYIPRADPNPTIRSQDQSKATYIPTSQGDGKAGEVETLTKLQYLIDKNFLRIDERLRQEYKLARYNVIQVKRQVVSGYNYWITYRNSYTITTVFKVYINIQGEMQIHKQSQTKSYPMLGAPETWSKEQYTADPIFLKIDKQLRNTYDLAGFFVVETLVQLVNGQNYNIAYINGLGKIIIFKVYASFQGQISIVDIQIGGDPSRLSEPEKHIGSQVLTKVQYLTDRNFRSIDDKLRKEFELYHFNVLEVVRTLVNGFIYEITYAKGGSSYYFKVFINFKGDTIQIKEKAKKQGAEDIVGAPQTLSKAQYQTDQGFIKIDNKLRRQYELGGFSVVEVIKQIVAGYSYTISYVNEIQEIYIFNAIIFLDEITLAEISKNSQIDLENRKTLARADYLRDKNFLQIDHKLRSERDLAHFIVSEVSRQFIGGYNYFIQYKRGTGTFAYKVYISPSGRMQILDKKQEYWQEATQTPWALTKNQYSTDSDFLKIDAYLKNYRNLTGFTPVEVIKKSINSYLYSIAYVNGAKDIYIFKVLYLKNEIQVQFTFEGRIFIPIGYSLDQLKSTDSFSACLYFLIQSKPEWSAGKIVSVAQSQDPNSTYYELIINFNSVNYGAKLKYDNRTKTASIQSIASMATIDTLHY